MNHYEFCATHFVDWRDRIVLYVKANSSEDAITYMKSITDPDDESKRFADFGYRCYVPENCLWHGIEVIDSTIPPVVWVLFKDFTREGIQGVEFIACEANGRRVATISRIKTTERCYVICYDHFVYKGAASTINWAHTGYAANMEEAKTKVFDFCQSIDPKPSIHSVDPKRER
ncbi:MAG: hypothetical protein ACK45I_03055 [Bacteroidota bacterium]